VPVTTYLKDAYKDRIPEFKVRKPVVGRTHTHLLTTYCTRLLFYLDYNYFLTFLLHYLITD
jgi:hypothetical protein